MPQPAQVPAKTVLNDVSSPCQKLTMGCHAPPERKAAVASQSPVPAVSLMSIDGSTDIFLRP